MKKHGSDYLLLRGRKIPVDLADIEQDSLLFYLDNPRLYTLIRADGKEPSQEEVEETLAGMDHVKQLVQSIKENGGLMDPVIVQGGTNIVLEGNSRLAAYRLLAKQDPIRWGLLRAKVLPEDISETEIFSLLGEYHIIGKKDWAPFEQAGYLHRRHLIHDVPVPQLAKEINLSKRKISHLIAVYSFMLKNKERDVNRWSYYDEYLKSSKIKRAREKFPDLDKSIVSKIRSGEIPKAVNVRDDLKKIVEAGGKVLEKFATGKRSFDESVEAAQHKGVEDASVRHVKKFKEWLGTAGIQADIVSLEGDAKNHCIYELRKIQILVNRLLTKISPK